MAKLARANNRDAIVLLSGGLDSMVVAGLVREAGYRVSALTIDYNQRHRCEIEAATTIAKKLAIDRHVIVPLDLRKFGGSALTDEIPVPKRGLSPDIPVTYVAARNLLFLSLTLAWAEPLGARDIFIGVNALDYSGYPDCRPEFIERFAQLANLATKAGIEGDRFMINAPLQFLSKKDIVIEADRLGLDCAMSWSCYDPQPHARACGECDSCRLRRAGFEAAELSDPTQYVA